MINRRNIIIYIFFFIIILSGCSTSRRNPNQNSNPSLSPKAEEPRLKVESIMPEALSIDIQRDQQGYLEIKADTGTEDIYEYKNIRTYGISNEELTLWIVLTRQDTSYQPYMSIDQPIRGDDLTYINELLQSQSFNKV